jgi:hypothetical protein
VIQFGENMGIFQKPARTIDQFSTIGLIVGKESDKAATWGSLIVSIILMQEWHVT